MNRVVLLKYHGLQTIPLKIHQYAHLLHPLQQHMHPERSRPPLRHLVLIIEPLAFIRFLQRRDSVIYNVILILRSCACALSGANPKGSRSTCQSFTAHHSFAKGMLHLLSTVLTVTGFMDSSLHALHTRKAIDMVLQYPDLVDKLILVDAQVSQKRPNAGAKET